MEEFLGQLDTFIRSDWMATAISVVVVVVLTAFAAHTVTHFLRHVLQKDETPLPSSSIFINVSRAAIWIIGVCIVLDTSFNVNVSAIIAALGVGGIAISLGFQDTIANLIGGLQVSLMKIVQPGDNIEVGSESGIVQDVTWRHTTIKNSAGEMVIVPNSVINKTMLVQLLPPTLVSLKFIVRSSGDDLDAISQQIELAALRATTGIASIVKAPKVVFSEVTEFGFRGTLTFRVADATQVDDASDAVLRAIAPLTRPAGEVHNGK